jgi:hypothetical protein
MNINLLLSITFIIGSILYYRKFNLNNKKLDTFDPNKMLEKLNRQDQGNIGPIGITTIMDLQYKKLLIQENKKWYILYEHKFYSYKDVFNILNTRLHKNLAFMTIEYIGTSAYTFDE